MKQIFAFILLLVFVIPSYSTDLTGTLPPQQKRVLEKIEIMFGGGTGYKVWTEGYPDLNPNCIIDQPIVQIASVDGGGAIGPIKTFQILKGGSYDSLCPDVTDGVSWIDDSNMGTGAEVRVYLTPKAPVTK